MTDPKDPMPSRSQRARWHVLVPSLLLLLALVPLLACGSGQEQEETVTAQTEEPMGAAAAPDMTEPGTPPAEEAGGDQEVAPEPTPPAPGVEAPPPASERSGAAAAQEPPVVVANEPPVPPEPEIAKAEPAPLPSAADQGADKQVFLSQHCNTCHAVSTAGIEAKVKSGPTAGPDLAGVRERRDRGSIEAILHQEEAVDGKKHPKRFSGSQEELEALVGWLLSQG